MARSTRIVFICVGPAYGGAAACRLTIRLPVDPDGDGRCRLREPQVGVRAKTASRVATAHHQSRQRAFKVVSLTWVVERTLREHRAPLAGSQPALGVAFQSRFRARRGS